MDGIKNSSSTTDHTRASTVIVVLIAMLCAAPLARGDGPSTSNWRGSLKRFSGGNVSLDSVQPEQRHRPVQVHVPARIIDATKSPIVAVVAAVESAVHSESLGSESPRPESLGSSTAEVYPTVEQALETRGSVTFRKTPISEVVFLLSDLWKINIVAGADVSGDVSGAFQNAPLSEVLSATLTASGYGYRQIGNSLVVLPLDQTGVAGIGIENSGAASGSSHSGIAYFTPQFTEAEQLAGPLQKLLGEFVIIAVYPEENRIMVKGTPDDLRLATEAIEQLDVPRPQVRITAMIYDVSLGELENLGVNWNREVRGLANGSDEALAEVTNSVSEFFAASAALTTTGTTSVGLRTINDTLNANVILEALDSTSEAKLLADPSITVADRTEASIKIVRQIPIITANPVPGSNAVFTQTQFKDAGVILVVTPRISRDGTIELRVSPEYSVVSEITANGPVIDSRTADTIVRVNNGQTFVLGGLRQKTVVESVRGIPYLRDIKYLGTLFRSHSTEIRESELVVFLKPELITPYYAGHMREQMAACVAADQLDRIPHAETRSIIPDCKDPLCPNHRPRSRVNCGSYSLEMVGGTGFDPYQVTSPRSVDILSQETPLTEAIETAPDSSQDVPTFDQTPVPLEPTKAEELLPPVHIDSHVIDNLGE